MILYPCSGLPVSVCACSWRSAHAQCQRWVHYSFTSSGYGEVLRSAFTWLLCLGLPGQARASVRSHIPKHVCAKCSLRRRENKKKNKVVFLFSEQTPFFFSSGLKEKSHVASVACSSLRRARSPYHGKLQRRLVAQARAEANITEGSSSSASKTVTPHPPHHLSRFFCFFLLWWMSFSSKTKSL